MRLELTGFCGVDGVDGVVSREEGPPPEQALRAMARTVMQATRIARDDFAGLKSDAGDAGNIDLSSTGLLGSAIPLDVRRVGSHFLMNIMAKSSE